MSQQQGNQHNYELILRILQSKRLLSDHVDILEDYMNLRQIRKQDKARLPLILSGLGTAGLSVAYKLVSDSFRNIRIGIGGAALLIGVLAGRESLTWYAERSSLRLLTNQLDALNEYHGLMRKILNYLNEMFLLNSGMEMIREDRLARSSVDSITSVLAVLHRTVMDWDEKDPTATMSLMNYQPFEAVDWTSSYKDDCPEAISSKRLKELFNIFLYIQSQFVLRTCITLIENPHKDLNCQLMGITEFIKGQIKRKDLQPVFYDQSNKIKCSEMILARTRPSDDHVSKLKWTCSNLSTKLLVQLNQFERVHQGISQLSNDKSHSKQNEKKIKEIYDQLNALESIFIATSNEFDNAQIILRSLLNIDLDMALGGANQDNAIDNTDSQTTTTVDLAIPTKIDDEFFLLDGQLNVDENQCDIDPPPLDTYRNEKVLKSRFKPVLKQLKSKIDPLKEEMNKREKEFLQKQGVEMLDLKGLVETSSTESEDELDDDLVLRKKRPVNKPSIYDEPRQLLESKRPIGLFLPPLQRVCISEDVIE